MALRSPPTSIAGAEPSAGVPPSRLPWLAVGIVVSTTVVSHSFGRSTFGLLLPAVEAALGLSHGRAGVGGTIIYLAYLAGVLTVTWMAPRVEPIAIMRCGLAVAAVGLAVLATAGSYPQLLLGLALAGGAGAGIWITAPVIATAEVPPARRGLIIGLLSASIGLGTFAVGLGTNGYRNLVGDEDAWRPVWGVEALVTAALFAAAVLVVRPQRTDRLPAGGLHLAGLRALPNGVRVTAAYAAFGAVGAGINAFLAAALEEDAGLSRGQAGMLYAGMGLCAIVGSPLLGAVSDRLGRRPVMVAVLAAITVAMTLLASGSGAVAMAGVALLGVVWSSYPVLTAAYVRDQLDARAFATAFAAMTVIYSLAAMATPAPVGWLADTTGSFAVPFAVLAALAAAATLLLGSIRPGAVTSG